MNSNVGNVGNFEVGGHQRRALVRSAAFACITSGVVGVVIELFRPFSEAGIQSWADTAIIPIAIVAAPGYLACIRCPDWARHFLFPFAFNSLFYISLFFGVWSVWKQPRREIIFRRSWGLLSLLVLVLFLVMQAADYLGRLGDSWMNLFIPAWPLLLLAITLAITASLRTIKGWIYLAPFPLLALLFFIAARDNGLVN